LIVPAHQHGHLHPSNPTSLVFSFLSSISTWLGAYTNTNTHKHEHARFSSHSYAWNPTSDHSLSRSFSLILINLFIPITQPHANSPSLAPPSNSKWPNSFTLIFSTQPNSNYPIRPFQSRSKLFTCCLPSWKFQHIPLQLQSLTYQVPKTNQLLKIRMKHLVYK
jgi:hypothetical protein